MSEKDFTTEPTPIEEKISSEKLANDYLSFRESQIKENLQKVKESDDWTRNYSPKSPGPRPSYVEPGSMDASDWDLAQGEYDQLEEQREGDLNDNEIRKQELYSEMDEIGILREQVLYGDKRIIDELANKERERLADIEDKKRKEEMKQAIFKKKKEGVVLEGVPYLIDRLYTLDKKHRLGEIPEHKTGSNGWIFNRYYKQYDSKRKYIYSNNGDSGRTFVEIITEPNNNIEVVIENLPSEQDYTDMKSKPVYEGNFLEFLLEGNRVHNWEKGVVREYPVHGTVHEFNVGPGSEQGVSDFYQADLDSAGSIIEELIADMNTISVEKIA